MQTVIAIIAIANGVASGNIPDKPRWQASYAEARALALDARKPLVVLIGTTKDWQIGIRDGKDAAINKWLRENYVCMYVDTTTAAGKNLASDFAVNGTGIIISDRSGNSQQFYHNGNLKRDDLLKALQRYADANRTFRSTETLAQLSPPPASSYQSPYYTPTIRLSGG